MRRIATALAAASVAVALMPAPGADASIAVADGTVVDSTGAPVPGATVTAYIWPDTDVLESLAIGQQVPEQQVGQATTAPDGSYALSVDATAVASAASGNGGEANLDIRTQDPSGALLGVGGFPVDPASSTAQAADFTLGADMTTATDASTTAPGPCPYNWFYWKRLPDRWGTVGEVHRWNGSVSTDRLTYGTRADSDYGWGFSLTGESGAWQIGGSNHIGNSKGQNGAAAVQPGDAYTGYRVEANFHESEYRGRCVTGPYVGDWTNDFKRVTTGWDGYKVQRGRHTQSLDGRCASEHPSYTVRFPASQYGWGTNTEKAVTFNQAISFGPFSVTGHSGFSTDVSSFYYFPQNGRQHVLCGNDALPASAHRVFAG